MKNLLLFSILFFTFNGAFSQLTVLPTPSAASTDSYLYVKNQILYVEGDVNLHKNNGIDQEASIYLREDGQLIQGGTTSQNDGDGYLSVQQNSPITNAYAYYYWCSPVGNPRTVDGSTIYPEGNTYFGLGALYEDQNVVPGIGTKALKTADVGTKEGYTEPQLTISKRWMYTHPTPGTEAEGNYIRINASNGAAPGFGFTMKGVNEGPLNGPNPTGPDFGHDQIYEFRGRPNNGDFEIPVQGPAYNGSGGSVPEARMTLTGNPYPSALDLNKLFYEPGNEALTAFYYYDEDRSKLTHLYSGKPFGYGVWVPGLEDQTPNNPSDFPGLYTEATFFIWNSAGNQGSSTGTGTTDNNKRYAPIGQGFMFIGRSDDIETVTIKNSHRVFIKEGVDTHSVFQRPTGNPHSSTYAEGGPILAPEDTRVPQTRIYAVFDHALTRDMLLVFSERATDGFDRGMDGISPGGMKTDAYFPVGDDNNRLPYVINSVNYSLEKQIPFAFTLNKPTQIQLVIKEEVKKPYEKIYLFDREENSYIRLSKASSLGSIINLPAGTYDNRFFIVFRNPNEDRPVLQKEAANEVRQTVAFFQNNPNQQLEVRNPQEYIIKSASMYDMSGKLVISKENLGAKNHYSFYTGHLSDGVYLVKLITEEDVIIDYKAIVHNR